MTVSMSHDAKTLRTVADLVAAGLIVPARAGHVDAVAARYAVAITPTMQALISGGDQGDPASDRKIGGEGDPIARQFVPSVEELDASPHERPDPIGDDAHSPLRGLVHRYPDRVLLKLVSVCPVYCRFCFRRETVGPQGAGHMSAEDRSR